MQFALLLLLLLWVICSSGRLAPSSADYRSHGVPFSVAPPCTVPFSQDLFAFEFVGTNNVSLSGTFSAVPGYPGAPRSAHRVLCAFARLTDSGITSELKLEMVGPRPSTSRIFNENHPSRMGGFLADNLVFFGRRDLLSAEGLLFKLASRYDEENPPLSDDGPAPGPGKCGGFELNVFLDPSSGGSYSLVRFSAETQTVDLSSTGSFRIAMTNVTESPSASACLLPLKKEMWDLSFTRGDQVLAAGSFATLSGVPGLPKGSCLAIAGNLNLAESIARGGPRQYSLVPVGPNQQYSPLYFWTYNGFWFFNNIFYPGAGRLVDTSGMLFSAQGNSFELSVYFQNEVGITCHGGPPAVCREVKDGHGYAFWIYQKDGDILHEKAFGNMLLEPRRTCSVSHPLELKEPVVHERIEIIDATPVEQIVESSVWLNSNGIAAILITAAAVILGAVYVFGIGDRKKSTV